MNRHDENKNVSKMHWWRNVCVVLVLIIMHNLMFPDMVWTLCELAPVGWMPRPPPDVFRTIDEIAENYGFAIEWHDVVTNDGYINVLHRVKVANKAE